MGSVPNLNSRLRNEAVTKLETRRVSEANTEFSSSSLTLRVTNSAFGSVRLKKSQPRRVTILAFGSARLKNSQPQRVRISISIKPEAISR